MGLAAMADCDLPSDGELEKENLDPNLTPQQLQQHWNQQLILGLRLRDPAVWRPVLGLADINSYDSAGYTPWLIAAEMLDLDAAKELKNLGCNVHAKARDRVKPKHGEPVASDRTALHIWALQLHAQPQPPAELLLAFALRLDDAGLSVTERDAWGATVLHITAAAGLELTDAAIELAAQQVHARGSAALPPEAQPTPSSASAIALLAQLWIARGASADTYAEATINRQQFSGLPSGFAADGRDVHVLVPLACASSKPIHISLAGAYDGQGGGCGVGCLAEWYRGWAGCRRCWPWGACSPPL